MPMRSTGLASPADMGADRGRPVGGMPHTGAVPADSVRPPAGSRAAAPIACLPLPFMSFTSGLRDPESVYNY